MVQLFLLFPESTPCNNWMVSNEPLQDVAAFETYVRGLRERTALLKVEDSEGYYDLTNVQNFRQDFDDVADLYPNPAFRLLRSYLMSFRDWRPNAAEDETADYTIYGQAVRSHTFSEVAERILATGPHFLIVNLDGHTLPSPIVVTKSHQNCELVSVSTVEALHGWLSANRQPARDFQITDKHGENRQDIRGTTQKPISPLRCSKAEAHRLLHLAVGEHKRELFFLDQHHNEYVVFRYEGDNPQQMYHGYHVPLDTNEVSPRLKTLIGKLVD